VALNLNRSRPIKSPQALDLVVRGDANSLLNRTIRDALPYEQVRNLSRIVQHLGHGPRREEWNPFAIHSTSEEASAKPFPLLHHLIPVTIPSCKVPVARRIRKESVKVYTPKSPPTTDYSPFDLAALHVFPHGARAQAQDFRRFA
jgi:hypothetical protein